MASKDILVNLKNKSETAQLVDLEVEVLHFTNHILKQF